MSTPTLYKTTEYSKFKLMRGNRTLKKKHVKELVKQIERHNLLLACPVIVNEKMEIIDGQHRVAAAQILEIPVYYVKETGLTIADVIMLNKSQRRWTLWDYIELYIEYGNENYRILKEFSVQHGINPSSCIILLAGPHSGITKTEAFKSGDFVVGSLEYAENLVSYMKDLQPHMRLPSIYQDDAFAAAVRRTDRILDEEYSGKTFEMVIDAFTGSADFIDKSGKVYEYMRSFENVVKKNKKMPGFRLF